jgi:metallo-beta-lactamase class B
MRMAYPSHAHVRTVELSEAKGTAVPQHGFADSLVLVAGKECIMVTHFGEGHTVDNVVGYFAKEDVLFGGCLIKELNATKGYLGDANVECVVKHGGTREASLPAGEAGGAGSWATR